MMASPHEQHLLQASPVGDMPLSSAQSDEEISSRLITTAWLEIPARNDAVAFSPWFAVELDIQGISLAI